MSYLPPPPGQKISPSTPSPVGVPAANTKSKISGQPRSASVIPLVIGVISIAVSLWIFNLEPEEIQISLLAYFLTPIVVVLCLGIDTLLQRKGLHDPWFSPKPKYNFILRILVLISFLAALPHIQTIAQFVGEFIAERSA
jgi:purine-cytosine permease-like protein